MSLEPSPTVGAMLRVAREDRALTVNDVAERTRIRSTLIREIESDNFFGCGDIFYARGHVRSIAVIVGVDPVAAVDRFDSVNHPEAVGPSTGWLPKYDPKAKPPPLPPPRTRVDPPPPVRSASVTVRPRANPVRSSQPGSKPSWLAAMIAAVIVVVLLAAASWLIQHARAPASSTAAPLPAFTSTSPKTNPSASPSPAPQHGIRLQIQATSGSTWLMVTSSNGKAIFQGIMDTGAVKEFSDPRQLIVRFGNSSAVTVTVNGLDKGTPSCGAAVCSETYRLDDAAG